MKQVRIGDARTHLSRYLEYVRRGGRIRILDRVTPVADLIPVEGGRGAHEDDRLLADLERRGVARRGIPGPIPPEILKPGPKSPGAGVVAALLRERRESR